MGRGPPAPAAPTPGPELNPQPTFAASTGLSLFNSAVTGGDWVCDSSGSTARARISSPPAVSAGQQYQYSFNVTANPGGDRLKLNIGTVSATLTTGTGTFSGTFTVGSSPSQVMELQNSDNLGAAHVSDWSLKLLS